MLVNVSYNNNDIFKNIDELVGKSFSLSERIKLGGIGSQRFIIRESSPLITQLLDLDTNLNFCNIEIRPGGIIIRFRSILETYAWTIPFYKLSIFKSSGKYAFYGDGLFVKVIPAHNTHFKGNFFKKLFAIRRKYTNQFSTPTH